VKAGGLALLLLAPCQLLAPGARIDLARGRVKAVEQLPEQISHKKKDDNRKGSDVLFHILNLKKPCFSSQFQAGVIRLDRKAKILLKHYGAAQEANNREPLSHFSLRFVSARSAAPLCS